MTSSTLLILGGLYLLLAIWVLARGSWWGLLHLTFAVACVVMSRLKAGNEAGD